MWVNKRVMCSFMVLLMCFEYMIDPASAEKKVDPIVNPKVVPNLEINPDIKNLIIFKNSSDVQVKWKAPILAASYNDAPAIGADNTIYLGFTLSIQTTPPAKTLFIKKDPVRAEIAITEQILSA